MSEATDRFSAPKTFTGTAAQGVASPAGRWVNDARPSIELPGEDHWLSRSETRQRMLTETLRFLQANNPAD